MDIEILKQSLIVISDRLSQTNIEDFSQDFAPYMELEGDLKKLVSQIAEVSSSEREPLLPYINAIEAIVDEKRSAIEKKLEELKGKIQSSNEIQKGIRTYAKNTGMR